MRQDPIEFAMVGISGRYASTEQTKKLGSVGLKSEPYAIDEAFARFERIDSSKRRENCGRRIVDQTLVSGLTAQLDAIDRQRARLSQLLRSVETHSNAE